MHIAVVKNVPDACSHRQFASIGLFLHIRGVRQCGRGVGCSSPRPAIGYPSARPLVPGFVAAAMSCFQHHVMVLASFAIDCGHPVGQRVTLSLTDHVSTPCGTPLWDLLPTMRVNFDSPVNQPPAPQFNTGIIKTTMYGVTERGVTWDALCPIRLSMRSFHMFPYMFSAEFPGFLFSLFVAATLAKCAV